MLLEAEASKYPSPVSSDPYNTSVEGPNSHKQRRRSNATPSDEDALNEGECTLDDRKEKEKVRERSALEGSDEIFGETQA